LLAHADDPKFQDRWAAVKHQNKERLALFVERQLGVKVDANALFDVQIKRLHEYKRQTLNILGVIHVCVTHSQKTGVVFYTFAQRYLLIKNMTPEEREKVIKKVVFFAGKAAPACMFLSFLSTSSPFVDRWFCSDYIAKLVSDDRLCLRRAADLQLYRQFDLS
jgi:glucan phosphorylase